MNIGLSGLFKIFKKKVTNGVEKLVDTRDKLEYIKDHYDEEVDKYIAGCQNLLVSEKQLKDKVTELLARKVNFEKEFEKQVKDGEDNKAKATFIRLKSAEQAYEMTLKAYDNVATQCEIVKTNLDKVDANKEILAAKIDYLNTQIEAINLSKVSGNVKFSVDCDAMLREVEGEIKLEQYNVEAKQEINAILDKNAVEEIPASSVDVEFEERVRQIRG